VFTLVLSQLSAAVSPNLLVIVLALMGFLGNMPWGSFLAWPSEVAPAEVYGTAFGFANGVDYLCAAFAPLVMSRLITKTGDVSNYTNACVFIAIIAAVGVLAAMLVRTGRREQAVDVPEFSAPGSRS
jgi:sugar phosphate permease